MGGYGSTLSLFSFHGSHGYMVVGNELKREIMVDGNVVWLHSYQLDLSKYLDLLMAMASLRREKCYLALGGKSDRKRPKVLILEAIIVNISI
ncbi:hypothetical protein MTR_2g007130 [Medicago truncatula]|uniref:Uncharacterized protein n=1 Tax=Medicago truncatula TaxID=3880 RepID=G7IPI1_MEDTR|nr:hypothetical protein MTR_2g007130 [Medicago truncatula]